MAPIYEYRCRLQVFSRVFTALLRVEAPGSTSVVDFPEGNCGSRSSWPPGAPKKRALPRITVAWDERHVVKTLHRRSPPRSWAPLGFSGRYVEDLVL